MTPKDRINAYIRVGLDVFLNGDDELRVRACKEIERTVRQRLIDAALPSLRQHKQELVEFLVAERAAAVEALLLSVAPDASVALPRKAAIADLMQKEG